MFNYFKINLKTNPMKSKKLFLALSFLFLNSMAFSQQIGNGFASYISDLSAPLLSGVYNGVNATGSTPDNNTYGGLQHLLVLRHNNPANNFQLQIASSFESNGRLFFRKLSASSPVSQNPVWNELATRGINTFVGNQNINGNLNIFNSANKIVGYDDPANYYIGSFPVSGSAGLDIHYFGGIRFGDATSNSVMQITNGKVGIGTTTPAGKLDVNGAVFLKGKSILDSDGANSYFKSNGVSYFENNGSVSAMITASGNFGIGTTDPKNKLSVNGTIWAKEVKVSLADAADWVFDKNYKLKPLADVEKYIYENKHLPEIPSAEEFRQNDMNVSEMSNKLLQKIEELTLYAIEQQKELDRLKTENESYKSLAERLSAIEKELKK